MIERSKGLERLFEGLLEENFADLSVKRLNAYRAHFNLDSMLSEVDPESGTVVNNNEDGQSYEYIEYKLDESDLKEDEILTETIEELDSSLIVKDEYEIEEEVYLEEEIQDESQETETYYFDEHESLVSKPRSEVLSQTDDEGLFSFQCHACNQPAYLKMKQLAQHCKNNHNCLPQVKCCSSECDAVLSTWRRLMIHKEKHFPNYDRLRCPQCQKVYMTEAGFEKHKKSHSVRYICSNCGKEFKEAKTLRWHEETHTKALEDRKNHECPYSKCGLKFITKQACQNHIGTKHLQKIIVGCKIPDCNKSFFTRKAYHEHMKNSHSERKYYCDQCNFKARTKSALNTHKDVHRAGDQFSCDLCNAVFSGYRRLKAHMVCHSNATPFQCHFCDSSFKRSKDLRSHILVHTKE